MSAKEIRCFCILIVIKKTPEILETMQRNRTQGEKQKRMLINFQLLFFG